MTGPVTGLRVGLAALGAASLARIIRREREAARGSKPLTPAERLERNGMAFMLIGFVAFLAFLPASGGYAAGWIAASLLVAAIALVLIGFGYMIASGMKE